MSTWPPHPGNPPYAPHVPPTFEQLVDAVRPALPVADREYHTFYRSPRFAWWKPLAAIALAALGWGLVQLVIGMVWVLWSIAEGKQLPTGMDDLVVTPEFFLINNVGVALAIPVALGAHWAVFGQRPRWLSSVAGGFRWGWFGRCLVWTVPLWVATLAVEFALAPPQDVRWREYTVFMIVVILLTTPFQAAGEEYLMRGLQQRAVGSWFRNPVIGWVVATIVSSLTFMSLHLAQDVWLNAYYLVFGVAMSWLVWRSGGLEAAVAVHVVNNMTAEALMPFTDFSGMMDRSAGAGDATVLIGMGVMVAATALLTWQARRRGLTTASAPGRAQVEAAGRQVTPSRWTTRGWRPNCWAGRCWPSWQCTCWRVPWLPP